MGKRIFDASGWFAINNAVFDVIMPELSPNAFKVLCVAIRQTWGWIADPDGDPTQRREADRISYSQFMNKAGIGSRHTVSRAIRECLEAGFLLRHEAGRVKGTGKPIYAYSLNTDYEMGASAETAPEKLSSAETALASSAETALASSAETALTKIKETNKEHGVGDHTNKTNQAFTTLTSFGVSQTVARRLASERSLEAIEGWIAYAEDANGLTNPIAFVVARLRDGETPPEVKAASNDDPRRYISGEYADYIQT